MVSEPHGVPGRQGPFPRLSRDDDGRDSGNSVSKIDDIILPGIYRSYCHSLG